MDNSRFAPGADGPFPLYGIGRQKKAIPLSELPDNLDPTPLGYTSAPEPFLQPESYQSGNRLYPPHSPSQPQPPKNPYASPTDSPLSQSGPSSYPPTYSTPTPASTPPINTLYAPQPGTQNPTGYTPPNQALYPTGPNGQHPNATNYAPGSPLPPGYSAPPGSFSSTRGYPAPYAVSPANPYNPQMTRSSELAIAAIAISAFGLFFILLAIIGAIMGHIDYARQPQNSRARKQAMTAFVIGWGITSLQILVWILIYTIH